MAAATNKPAIGTGTKPNTIPDNNGPTNTAKHKAAAYIEGLRVLQLLQLRPLIQNRRRRSHQGIQSFLQQFAAARFVEQRVHQVESRPDGNGPRSRVALTKGQDRIVIEQLAVDVPEPLQGGGGGGGRNHSLVCRHWLGLREQHVMHAYGLHKAP